MKPTRNHLLPILLVLLASLSAAEVIEDGFARSAFAARETAHGMARRD